MVEMWVAADEAARGDLPPLCARRGIRCITRYPEPVRKVPAALEWATWQRVWPLGRDQPDATIVLPLLPEHRRLARWLEATRDVTAAALGGALLVALLTSALPARVATVMAWAALAVHVLVAAAGVLLTVRVTPDTTGKWVHLSRVSPRFARAVRATCSTPRHRPEPASWRPRPTAQDR